MATSFVCDEGYPGAGVATCDDSHGSVGGPSGTLDTSTVGAHTYSVTATDGHGMTTQTQISDSIQGAPANSSRPAVSGVAESGQTLTCGNGTWSNHPTSFTSTWFRDGVAIPGATWRTPTRW